MNNEKISIQHVLNLVRYLFTKRLKLLYNFYPF